MGTRVIHDAYGRGELIPGEGKNIIVRFDDGSIITYNEDSMRVIGLRRILDRLNFR